MKKIIFMMCFFLAHCTINTAASNDNNNQQNAYDWVHAATAPLSIKDVKILEHVVYLVFWYTWYDSKSSSRHPDFHPFLNKYLAILGKESFIPLTDDLLTKRYDEINAIYRRLKEKTNALQLRTCMRTTTGDFSD